MLLPGSVSAEPAIEAQTLFLAINELYGVLLGAEIDRCDGLGLPRIAPDCIGTPLIAPDCLELPLIASNCRRADEGTVRRLEALIRHEFPDIKHVDIEPDGIHLSNWHQIRKIRSSMDGP